MKNLQVTVEEGKIRGIHGWDPRVAVFRGIPYAAPPVGEQNPPSERCGEAGCGIL